MTDTAMTAPAPHTRGLRALTAIGTLLVVAGLLAAASSWLQEDVPAGLDMSGGDGGTPGADAVTRLQGRVKSAPGDARAWAALGSAYVERARVSADPSWYPKAEGALHRSLELGGDANVGAMVGMGQLANARHDFAGALAWGERARTANPSHAAAHGVAADALTELGRYDEAVAAVQRMVNLRPALDSLARVSYARELRGDWDGARIALEEGARLATSPADAAFAAFQLGELAWHAGQIDQAEPHYARALKLDPSFAPPQAGLARLRAARGDTGGAVDEYRAVTARLPAAQYVAELGDLYAATGDRAGAARQAELVGAMERLSEANGVNVDLELSLYRADHGLELGRGLAAAEAEYGRRHSVFAADALAWQLHVNGRHAEALARSDEALRLGTRNASFLFHRGMIKRALGDKAGARADITEALALNPQFSILQAPVARAALAELA